MEHTDKNAGNADQEVKVLARTLSRTIDGLQTFRCRWFCFTAGIVFCAVAVILFAMAIYRPATKETAEKYLIQQDSGSADELKELGRAIERLEQEILSLRRELNDTVVSKETPAGKINDTDREKPDVLTKAEKSSRVYIHYGAPEKKARAFALRSYLLDRGYNVEEPELIHGFYGEIRYFHEEDCTAAAELLREAEAFLKGSGDLKLRNLSNVYRQAPARQMEIWM